MQIALVGCGYVSAYYIQTLPLHPELVLRGVMDRDDARSGSLAKILSVHQYESLNAVLEDDQVDIVLNLTNPRNHYEVTRACLEAGKHVYTEKPLAMSLSRAKELVETADRSGLYLASAPCTLLNDAGQTFWKAVRDKVVGDIRLVYAEMDDGMVHRMPYRKWVTEYGVGWPYRDEFETGCTVEHAGYVLTWLAAVFGPAKTVTAFSSCLVPNKIRGESEAITTPDFSVACIQFESGVVARMTCGLFAPKDLKIQCFGDEGVLYVDDSRVDRSAVYSRKYISVRRRVMLTPWKKRCTRIRTEKYWGHGKNALHRDFCSGMAEMSEAIKKGCSCRLNASFSLHVNELTLAIQNARDTDVPYRMTTTFDPIQPLVESA